MAQTYARLDQAASTVIETLSLPDGVDVFDAMHPELAPLFIECPPEVKQGWVYDGAAFHSPSPPIVTPIDLVAYAADRRWQKETGGIIVAGVPVATDDRSKLMITGARVAAMADPSWSTVWSGTDGGSYPVDAEALIAISDAVQAHVNSGFATFATVKAAIDAGEIKTTAEIDAAFA